MAQKKTPTPNHSSVEIEEENTNNPHENGRLITRIREAPLPEPHELREYKSIDKTLPDRIMKLAEKEQSFRHYATYLGQSQFIVLVLGGYGLAAYAGIHGAQWAAGAIAVGVSYVAYVFKSNKPKPPKAQSGE